MQWQIKSNSFELNHKYSKETVVKLTGINLVKSKCFTCDTLETESCCTNLCKKFHVLRLIQANSNLIGCCCWQKKLCLITLIFITLHWSSAEEETEKIHFSTTCRLRRNCFAGLWLVWLSWSSLCEKWQSIRSWYK